MRPRRRRLPRSSSSSNTLPDSGNTTAPQATMTFGDGDGKEVGGVTMFDSTSQIEASTLQGDPSPRGECAVSCISAVCEPDADLESYVRATPAFGSQSGRPCTAR